MRTVIRSNSIASRRGFYYGFMARFLCGLFLLRKMHKAVRLSIEFRSFPNLLKKRPLCSRTERPLFIKRNNQTY